MNLAIEYLLRDNKVHSLLSVPCSLFLTCDKGKLIITIHNSYGKDSLLVKHWRTWETKDKLPPFQDFTIDKKDVFSSPYTIVKNCRLLSYAEDPYRNGIRQSTEWPESAHQEQEYKNKIDNYLNSSQHYFNRTNWLWSQFEIIYMPKRLRSQTAGQMEVQRELAKFYSNSIWTTWEYWKKHFLNFAGPAAELVFARDYPKEETIWVPNDWNFEL